MELTGIAKDKFEEWYTSSQELELVDEYEDHHVYIAVYEFRQLSDSMKYGVYKVFFSQQNIFIKEDITSTNGTHLQSYDIYYSIENKEGGLHENIEESMKESIKDCNEIFNERKLDK